MNVRCTDVMIVLELTGELDIRTTPPVLDALTTALTERTAAKTVVFDLAGVTFMDSSAVKCFVYAHNRIRVRSGCVIACNAAARRAGHPHPRS